MCTMQAMTNTVPAAVEPPAKPAKSNTGAEQGKPMASSGGDLARKSVGDLERLVAFVTDEPRVLPVAPTAPSASQGIKDGEPKGGKAKGKETPRKAPKGAKGAMQLLIWFYDFCRVIRDYYSR